MISRQWRGSAGGSRSSIAAAGCAWRSSSARSGTRGAVMRQRFFERIYDLAHEICTVLKTFEPSAAGATAARPGGRTVYLAATTVELQPERDRLRRELLERGHRVLPDAPLPALSRD